MSQSKRRLLDALRDPKAGDVVKPKVERRRPTEDEAAPVPRKVTKRTRKPTKSGEVALSKKTRKRKKPGKTSKKPVEAPDWPAHWELNKVRCRGFTAKGVQCGRKSANRKHFCGAHKAQTLSEVCEEIARRFPVEPEEPPTGGSDDSPVENDGEVSGRLDISKVPEERQCQAMIDRTDGTTSICGGWSVKIDEGLFDKYCVNHSNDPRAVRARELRGEKGAKELKTQHSYNSVAKQPVFNVDLKTQDDVAAARLLVLRKLETGVMTPSAVGKALDGLDRVSLHIEKYGTHQGAEGGKGVLRLLPGTTLVQMETELDTVLTKEQLDQLELRLAEDEKAGVATPDDFSDVLERYLGLKTRRRDRSRNFEEK